MPARLCGAAGDWSSSSEFLLKGADISVFWVANSFLASAQQQQVIQEQLQPGADPVPQKPLLGLSSTDTFLLFKFLR